MTNTTAAASVVETSARITERETVHQRITNLLGKHCSCQSQGDKVMVWASSKHLNLNHVKAAIAIVGQVEVQETCNGSVLKVSGGPLPVERVIEDALARAK